MFSYVWLYFKKCFGKYFLMFDCVLENTIENTFSTCCSYFLTFSQLPNEYIISFIPKNTNKTQKRSHFLDEITIAITIEIDAISIGEIAIAQSVDRDRHRSTQFQWSRSRSKPIFLSLSHWVCFVRMGFFFLWLSLSLLRFFGKSFEGKTTM